MKFLAFNWLCAIAVYVFATVLLRFVADFGRQVGPIWPLIYIGIAALIGNTAFLFKGTNDPLVTRTLNSLVLGYLIALLLFLVCSYVDLTTSLQELRRMTSDRFASMLLHWGVASFLPLFITYDVNAWGLA